MKSRVVFFSLQWHCVRCIFVSYMGKATWGRSWHDKYSHILNPCAALSHRWSSSPPTLSRIRLPPIIAWKRCTLSSCLMSTNKESPDASTLLRVVCATGEFWIEEGAMSVGTLSDATTNCAAYGLRPARRRNVSHWSSSISIITCKREVDISPSFPPGTA